MSGFWFKIIIIFYQPLLTFFNHNFIFNVMKLSARHNFNIIFSVHTCHKTCIGFPVVPRFTLT